MIFCFFGEGNHGGSRRNDRLEYFCKLRKLLRKYIPSLFCEYLPSSSIRALFKGGPSAESDKRKKGERKMQVSQRIKKDKQNASQR